MKRLIYFTADDHCVYAWSRGRLSVEAKFPGDDLGVTAFREYLAGRRGALFYAVADLAGEVGHGVEQGPAASRQVLAKRGDPEVVSRKFRLHAQPAARPRVHAVIVGGEIDQALHVRTSSC